MKLLFLGTAEFGLPAFDALRAAGHNLLAAISQPDRPAGRKLEVRPTPVHAHAAAAGVPHLQVANVNTDLPDDLIAAAELGIVVAFGQKLGPALLKHLPRGFVNIHGSLLPKYRGAAPVQWAVINGDATTGVTTFQLDEKWDNGPIWGRRETAIGETETADELHDRLAHLGAELIVETVHAVAAGTARPQPQLAAAASRAPKLSRADGCVDWLQPAAVVARRINGLWSWPAATCIYAASGGRRERVQLARARVAVGSGGSPAAPGELLAGGRVQTGAGEICVLEIKPEGGRLMAFEAFARGRRVVPGDRFLPLDAP